MKTVLNCLDCGVVFISTRKDKIYCSRSCARKHYDYKSIANLVCEACGKEFSIEKSDYTRRLKNGYVKFYCSRSCSIGTINSNRYEKRILICEGCKKQFIVNESDAKDKYCSKRCYFGHQSERILNQCLKIVDNKNRYKKGVFFSPKNNKELNYRSSWELKYMEYLEKDSTIESYQYESIRLPYLYRKNKRWYIPDFIVGNRIIEIKPKYLLNKRRNLAKFSAARQYCQVNNMIFELLTEVELKQLGIL